MKESIFTTCLFVLVIIISTVKAEPEVPGVTVDSSAAGSGYIDVDGGRIFYEGAGHGPTIVMIHDGVLHSATWNAQFAKFAESHRVIRWDRRGYGRSDKPNAPFSNLDDLFKLMTVLKVDRATLVGCSSGSLLAIEFALAHPDMISSLILVGPIVSGFGFSKHFGTRGDYGKPGRDAPVEQKIEYWTARDPWIMAPESKAARKTLRNLLVENPQDLTGSGSFSRWPGFSCMGRLPEINVPTLLVVGESDIPDVHTHAGVIQAGIKGSRRVVLAHSGHLAHFEVPDVFNQVVLDFLEPVE